MKEPVVALEISHKYLKMVFGFIKDNQVIISYVRKVPLNHPLENGVVKDHASIVKELSKNNPVVDHNFDLNHLIDNAILVLPPYGLEIYETQQFTSVISPEKIVGELDIKNIYNIIRNKKLPIDNQLIDIIPDSFALDNGNRYALPPIGKESSAITVHAKVHTLPKRINDEHTSCLVDSNIQVKRRVIAPFGVSELLSTYNDVPSTYFLVDIGANSTTISLVDNNQLFATRSFSWGGDNITSNIMTSFNISEKEAEKIKILFGLDKREMKFDYPVYKSSLEGETTAYTVKALNEIIEKELNSFVTMLNVGLEQLANTYSIDEYTTIPLLLIGGGSNLKGLRPFLNQKIRNPHHLVKLKSIGARDTSLAALVGSILVNYKYPVDKKDTITHVDVVRDE